MEWHIAELFVLGWFGAFLQELVHWYDLRAKLNLQRYRTLLRSRTYWVITTLMLFGAGGAAIVWFESVTKVEPARQVLLFGFSLPLILKKLGATFAESADKHLLGEGTVPRREWRDYLGLQ